VDFPRFGGQFRASRRGAFEHVGADAAQVTVAAGSIVEHLQVIEDIGVRQVKCFVGPFLDALFLQAAEEGLSHSVVPTVAAGLRLLLAQCVKPLEDTREFVSALRDAAANWGRQSLRPFT
jgi:hypothetical protein